MYFLKNKISYLCRAGVVALGTLGVASAHAAVVNVDFEEFAHGEIVTTSKGIGVSANNTGGGPDIAVVMDSGFDHNAAVPSSGDPDLVAPFGAPTSGALAQLPADPGKILVVQEDGSACNATMCNPSDDEGGGGVLGFDFTGLVLNGVAVDFVDIIDIDDGESVKIILNYAAGGSDDRTIPGSDIGDSNATRLDLSALFAGANTGVASLEIDFSSSGATGGFQITTDVPEPASLALLGFGLLGMGLGYRRRRTV